MSRTYWRSLAQIEDRPEFRAALEREFPEGASELPEGITRRDMMMLLGASLSLAGLAGCRRPVEEIVPYVTAPEEIVPGIPRYYATTMPFRRSAYGLIVESHEGRPTKIEGNPSHPSTLGASSSRVQASVLGLYDPDRSQSVTLKGAPKSWSDFVTAWGQLSAGSCRGWRRRPCGPLRVLLLADPGAPGLRAPRPLSPGCSGRPTTPSATRTGSRDCGRPRGATSISCSGSIEPR